MAAGFDYARGLQFTAWQVSIRRRIVRFTAMVFVPLIFGILQNDDLSRRQQGLDLFDDGITVRLEAKPDLFHLNIQRPPWGVTRPNVEFCQHVGSQNLANQQQEILVGSTPHSIQKCSDSNY